jgi:putative addiction module component (TIGR02574 family)
MSMTLEELKAEALNLPSEEREWLADILYASVDGEEEDEAVVEQAWREEIRHRIEEIDSGVEPGIPAEEVFARLRGDASAVSPPCCARAQKKI